ncbi:MAG: sensor histidine kinase [Mycobacterium leprae]
MRRLATRLLVSNLLVAVTVLLATGTIAGSVLYRYLQQQDQVIGMAHLEEATRVAGVIVANVPDIPRDQLRRVLSEAFAGVKLTDAGIGSGDLGVSTSGMFVRGGAEAQVVGIFPASESNRERIITVHEPGNQYALRVSLDSPQTVRNSTLGWSLAGAGLLGLVVAILLAYGISRSMTAPLSRMTQAAELLAEGEWETPIPAGGPEEIQQLAQSFQTMAGKLGTEFGRVRDDRRRLLQLVAEVAHELKTPITSLRTYHELLLAGEQENVKTRQELLERGAGQVARLEYLTHSLLELARLEADAQALDLTETDLVALARNAVAAIAPVAEQRGLQLELATPALPVVAVADAHRLGQAIDNLLQNALRFSPVGSTVTVSVRVKGKAAQIAVADCGPGISDALLPHLFEPFVRGEGSRGTGLGLAIVRAVAEAHGGSVMAENRPSGGAEVGFSVELV